MSVEDNKRIVWSWFEALMSNDLERVRALVDPECVVFLAGDMPCCGRYDLDGWLAAGSIAYQQMAGPMNLQFGEMTAEGDRVCLEMESTTPLVSGATYRNQYHFLFHLRAGKVVVVKVYWDTLHMYRSLVHEQIQGPPKERESNLFRVTRSLEGVSAE